jgi:tetratricopeptide (TPR) repeat protein
MLVLGVWSFSVLALLAWRTTEQLKYWRNTETLFDRVLAMSPNSVQALYGLGSYFIEAGRIDEGKKLVERAIALQPTYAEALGTLANTLDGEGKYDEATRFYDAALKTAPNHSGVLNNLAWLRAACPDPKFRDGPEAVRLALRACELTGYGKPLFIGTLAAAYAQAGDFQAAISTAERAAVLASSLRLEDIAARNRQLIELYRQGKTAK